MNALYRPATLYQGKNEWYVYYFFLNTATFKYERFKERFDMNRIKDKGERLVFARDCVKFVNARLKEGFNPFTAVKASNITSGAIKYQLQAFVEYLIATRQTCAPKTYRQARERFKRFIDANCLQSISMAQVTGEVASSFQGWMISEKLAPKTINNTISHVALFWDAAKAKKMVVGNPFREMKAVKKRQGADIYEPFSPEEMKSIFDWLNANGYRGFVRYLFMIYYAFARPIEITRLRVSDIDLTNDVITFRASQTKSNKGAQVQIVAPLKKVLIEMDLDKYPGTHYLFSGRNFLPGKIKKDNNKLGTKWKELVQVGLEIPKLMYALKHTGNIHYLLNNKGKADLKWQQMQNRHSSAAMTERYNRSLGAYFIDTAKVKFNTF